MLENLRSTMRFRSPTLSQTKRKLDRAASIDDLRLMAKDRLPGGVFDYIDGGAESEQTLRNNRQRFGDYNFRPRVLRDVENIDTSTQLLGRTIPLPLILAPTGFTRIGHSEGELATSRAAARLGIPYTLSTLGTRSIEEVAAVCNGPKWFQVYVWRDRGLVKEMIDRARDADYEAICITVDLATLGRRERDVRRGFTLPPQIGLDTIIDGIRHPGWTWNFVRSEPIVFANVTSSKNQNVTDAVALSDYTTKQLDPSLNWKDIEWFRSIWDGPIIVKGIQDVEDAKIAADIGIESIALSNHGGRQLDAAPAPIDLVPQAAQAVGDQVEIICDGGIRRGADMVKALALGASACMVGKAYLYGLGAAGEPGVDKALGFLQDEFVRTMTLIGASSVDDLTPSAVTRTAHLHEPG